ncbi:hypothetical protein BGZ46_004563, partial [Entomortierella lignicola]
MSSLQYNQPSNLISMEDPAQSLAPRTALSMEEMMAMLSTPQFSNDSTAIDAAVSRNWRQGQATEQNYITAAAGSVGGHRRNH